MDVQRRLLELAEEDYKQFSAALVPGVENMLGIRLPKLRALAKELARGDWRSYLKNAGDDYFEETMLQGMVIGCARMDPQERLRHVAAFVPKIDNWSVNDSFCAGLKAAKKEPALFWDFLQPYLASEGEYDVRFGR